MGQRKTKRVVEEAEIKNHHNKQIFIGYGPGESGKA